MLINIRHVWEWNEIFVINKWLSLNFPCTICPTNQQNFLLKLSLDFRLWFYYDIKTTWPKKTKFSKTEMLYCLCNKKIISLLYTVIKNYEFANISIPNQEIWISMFCNVHRLPMCILVCLVLKASQSNNFRSRVAPGSEVAGLVRS